ncbi:glutaminase [Microbacterium sp. Gd 4-13]|uniref:glutaminase n=1 Tax=Microbacterium sp. Gd 4-13 TaxID=2173179 RepID=UPI000D56CCC1|nr:glutaminase [Microbacterium sp. Gd 4-13]PVW04178.1 glutaminase [Microbacterium sp. Gd 4-13]
MIADILHAARRRLDGAPKEALGELKAPRPILGIARAPRIVPAGEVWHLGVLLLADEQLAATGQIVRAREEARRGYTAESQRERAALAAAAFRGGFGEGSTVHVGWRLIDVDDLDAASSPVAVVDGQPMVRWSATGGLMPLERYLHERIELLQHPPERA